MSSTFSAAMAALDATRLHMGFLTPAQLMERVGASNFVLDPFSVIISSLVEFGTGNTFYPNTILHAESGELRIGDDNVFLPGAFLHTAGGSLSIGHGNQLGEGGVTLRANHPDARIVVDNQCRLVNGAALFGVTRLGRGAQVIGPIVVQHCELEDGESFQHPDPDLRGGVLKGSGTARGLRVSRGYVLNAQGDFGTVAVERQGAYHTRR